MIPYVIINGVSSRTINGLMIQSLAPITKPKMRTETDTIDGMDGEIITKLGYEAYTKSVLIGLYKNFDIDEVIAFFDQSGTVTFSNENDKYYNFGIYDQIDFERLVRYRTANVNFRVQPFKYSTAEPDLIWEPSNQKTYHSIRVNNIGNIESRPRFVVTAKGQINIYINNAHVLTGDLGSVEKTVIIDDMNAVDLSGNFLNRQFVGDYGDLKFEPGPNDLYITGQISKLKLERYSRWI